MLLLIWSEINRKKRSGSLRYSEWRGNAATKVQTATAATLRIYIKEKKLFDNSQRGEGELSGKTQLHKPDHCNVAIRSHCYTQKQSWLRVSYGLFIYFLLLPKKNAPRSQLNKDKQHKTLPSYEGTWENPTACSKFLCACIPYRIQCFLYSPRQFRIWFLLPQSNWQLMVILCCFTTLFIIFLKHTHIKTTNTYIHHIYGPYMGCEALCSF